MAITNPFTNLATGGQYQIQMPRTMGGYTTGINPNTGLRENIVRDAGTDASYASGDEWVPQTNYNYGFKSENPTLDDSWSRIIANPNPKDSGTFNTTLGLLGVLGGAAGAAFGAAGAGGASLGEGATSAFPYSTGSLGWDAGGGYTGNLLGGAGVDTLAEGGSTMANGADEFGNFDMGNGATGTQSSIPSSVMQQVQQIPGGSNVLSRILNGTATSDDYLSAAGKAVATALGIYGSNRQAGQYQTLANTNMAYGAPSRARFEASMTPGFDPSRIPGYTGAVDSASKAVMARLAAQGGNPYGDPRALTEANKAIISGTALPAIQEFQRLNANTGYGNTMNSANTLSSQAIGADRGVSTAVASGIGDLTAPSMSMADLIKQIQNAGSFRLNDALI